MNRSTQQPPFRAIRFVCDVKQAELLYSMGPHGILCSHTQDMEKLGRGLDFFFFLDGGGGTVEWTGVTREKYSPRQIYFGVAREKYSPRQIYSE